MSQTIWKTILKPETVQRVVVPAGAEILCAREQYDDICIWYRCDPHAPKETRSIAVIRTGTAAPDDGRFLGTASLRGGALMFHMFERPTGGRSY